MVPRSVLVIVAALVLAATGSVVRAHDIWAIAGETVLRVDSATGAIRPARRLPPVRALAPVSGVRAWALTDDTLLLIDQDLEPLVSVQLPPASADAVRMIAGDPIEGGVWLAEGSQLSSFDASGTPARQWTVDGAISALAFAGPEAVYVAAGSRIARFDDEGALRGRIELPSDGGSGAARLLVDVLGGLLWIVRDDGVLQLDAIAGLAIRRRIEFPGPIVATSLDPLTGEVTLAARGHIVRFDRDAVALGGFGGPASAELLHGPWGVAIDVPIGVAPTLSLARQDTLAAAQQRFVLQLGAQCDGNRCAPTPDYLRTLRLDVVLGHRTLGGAFAASESASSVEGVVEIDASDPDAQLRATVADAYGRVSDTLVVSPRGPDAQREVPRAKANAPPVVSITAPGNNASFAAPATVVVNANATDSDGTVSKVEFFRNGTLVSTDTSSPWTATLSGLAIGTYALTAKATDNTGASTTSAAVNIQVKANVAPTVSLTAPANNAAFTAPATIVLTATAADSDGGRSARSISSVAARRKSRP